MKFASRQRIGRWSGAALVKLHFELGRIACDGGTWAPGSMREDLMLPLQRQYDVPPGLLGDLGRDLLQVDECEPVRRESMPALLLERTTSEGVPGTLTLDLMGGSGAGALYPATELVFLPDHEFWQAAESARSYVRDRERLWTGNEDVRWRLTLLDGRAWRPLSGPSVGGAFGLLLAKLMVADPR